jgi:hypothetical protein
VSAASAAAHASSATTVWSTLSGGGAPVRENVVGMCETNGASASAKTRALG